MRREQMMRLGLARAIKRAWYRWTGSPAFRVAPGLASFQAFGASAALGAAPLTQFRLSRWTCLGGRSSDSYFAEAQDLDFPQVACQPGGSGCRIGGRLQKGGLTSVLISLRLAAAAHPALKLDR